MDYYANFDHINNYSMDCDTYDTYDTYDLYDETNTYYNKFCFDKNNSDDDNSEIDNEKIDFNESECCENDYSYECEDEYEYDSDLYYESDKNKNIGCQVSEKIPEKIYKNPILVELKKGFLFEKEDLLCMVKKYSKDFNDYLFMKKVFESNGENKSVKKYIEYSEFIDNITDLFDDQEEKRNLILKLAKKSKKVIQKNFDFDFDIYHPSDELVKFVHKKFKTQQEKEIEYLFKLYDVKKKCFEGYLIYKIALNILKKKSDCICGNIKYLSDKQLTNIFEKLCKKNNLNYTKNSIYRTITTIKNFSEETFEDED